MFSNIKYVRASYEGDNTYIYHLIDETDEEICSYAPISAYFWICYKPSLSIFEYQFKGNFKNFILFINEMMRKYFITSSITVLDIK